MSHNFRISLVALRADAKKREIEFPGYLEDVMSKGVVNGEYLEIPIEEHVKLIRKYNPKPYFQDRIVDPMKFRGNVHQRPENQRSGSMRGVGDVVAAVAQPIAHTIDKVFGTNVAGCGGCKKRQEKLNQAFPFNTTKDLTK